MQRILGVIVLLLLSSAQYTVVNALSQTVIRVCRNKHCCKRNPHLLQTIYQLETQAKIESSGCLSHCDNGPNVEIENSSSSTILNGVVDATTAAVLIEQAIDGAPIPKLLTAASKLMERVHSRQDSAEKLRFLNSVISKLGESTDHSQSTAISRAFALRAQVSFDGGNIAMAIEDAKQALTLKDVATSSTITLAYRTWVDAEEHDPKRAIAVLQRWHQDQPQFRIKVASEIQRLVDNMPDGGKSAS